VIFDFPADPQFLDLSSPVPKPTQMGPHQSEKIPNIILRESDSGQEVERHGSLDYSSQFVEVSIPPQRAADKAFDQKEKEK